MYVHSSSQCDYAHCLGLAFVLEEEEDEKHETLTEFYCLVWYKKVQVGKDQEKAQSEKDSHSKNRGGKKPN